MIKDELRAFLTEKGVSDVGFSVVEDGDFGSCKYAVSIVVKLSDAIVDEIDDSPTYTYFNHYRSVNAYIDSVLLQAGMFLEKRGYKYITVAASQSINSDGWSYMGRYSHKKAACMAGLGVIGKNSLFLHKDFGARVRLGTVFTDCPLEEKPLDTFDYCMNCDICVKACPCGAIKGIKWSPHITREEMFSPEKCSEFMKTEFKNIGRGAVCGICLKVCPAGGRKIAE